MKYLIVQVLSLIGFCNSSNAQLLSATDTIAIRVNYFTAAEVNSKTVLKWKVTCFLDYAKFELQRSNDGVEYATISTFSADKLRCLQPFDFEDRSLDKRTFYRLKVGDKDGRFYTSQVLVASGPTQSFEVTRIIPSLITTHALISISSAVIDKVNILITNMEGTLMKSFTYNLARGNTDVRLNLADLAKGSYTINIRNSQSDNRTVRLLKM